MLKNEIYLLKENDLFVFNRRENRLFHIISPGRIEITDNNFIANILISNAAVIYENHVNFNAANSQGKHDLS